jgi:hypothetical protein
MLSDDTLRQLVLDRTRDRDDEAEAERVAREPRAVRALLSERPMQTALLGRFLAARRHALP